MVLLYTADNWVLYRKRQFAVLPPTSFYPLGSKTMVVGGGVASPLFPAFRLPCRHHPVYHYH